ncbi:ATP synthase complex assembly protein Atp25 [Schizosaccharomyces octosporus yFS286]|uniref:ATPase synthesis protein 25 n=1 Tax=Schizosaccharomyces octosporus (strain yFS286) TaxID=483514 RepID=S9PQ17_SCHOY|nr:ATP synthase complex assembly protein Atp25 [Schizosaccharomyces octosporus yFS286]EPX71331.1 ATP synthase complex assembly protein Atp25 [Schizosaccharomyces octosporus yFS286]
MKSFPSSFRISSHFACRIHGYSLRHLSYRFFSSKSDAGPQDNPALDAKPSELEKSPEGVIRPWYVEYAERTFPKRNVFTSEIPPLPEAAPEFLQEVLKALSNQYLVSDLKFIRPNADQPWSTSDLMLLGTCNDDGHVISVTRGISQKLKDLKIGTVQIQGLPNLSRQRILNRRALKRPEAWHNKMSTQKTNWTCIHPENYNVIIHLFTKEAREFYQLETIDQDLQQILSENHENEDSSSTSFRQVNKKKISSERRTSPGDRRKFHTSCMRNDSIAKENASFTKSLNPFEEARRMYLAYDDRFSLESFSDHVKSLLDRLASEVSVQDVNTLLTAVALSAPPSINSLESSRKLVSHRIQLLTSLYTSIQKTTPIDITELRRILSKCLICSCMVETSDFHYLDPRIYKTEQLMYRHGISMTVKSYMLILNVFAKYNRWKDVWIRWSKLTNIGILLDEDMYCHIFRLVAESKNERAAIYALSNIFEDMLSQSPELAASKDIAVYLSRCLDLISFQNDNSYRSVHKYIQASKSRGD